MAGQPLSIASTGLRRGTAACPALFRIVPARDGGLCRVRIPLGQLGGAQSRALAGAASRFGSGVIEVTNRANLQIRGIAPGGAAGIAETLVAADLGPARPGADDIRNVMVNPTAGIDPAQSLDTRPLARSLLDHVQSSESCRALSPKFCFLIDGGEDVAVVDHPHDFWLSSLDGERMAVGFAGCPPVAADDTAAAGTVRQRDAVAIIDAAVGLFQEMAAGDPAIARLRDLFAVHPRDEFVRRLGSRLERSAESLRWRRREPRSRVAGIGRQGDGLAYVAAIPPLGRLSPAMLAGAAEIASRYGSDELRLTPWQSLFLPSIRESDAGAVVFALEELGFVCRSDEPLARMIACAGAPGCSSGRANTKADARALAGMLSGGAQTVHLSGCEKSCASAALADNTLVAVASGLYDLYAKGPEADSRFGRMVTRAATLDQAASLLRDSR